MTKEIHLVPERSEKFKGKDRIIHLWSHALTEESNKSVRKVKAKLNLLKEETNVSRIGNNQQKSNQNSDLLTSSPGKMLLHFLG